MVLDRVGDVPWSDLWGGYGLSEWVPEALLGLLDLDPDARTEAFDDLQNGVLNDGDGFVEATPRVVPFLIELAASADTPDRPKLLRFLAEIVGNSELDPAPDQAAADREVEECDRVGRVLYPTNDPGPIGADRRACQASAWRDRDALLGLLADPDPEVRIVAGIVLALLVKDGHAAMPDGAGAQVADRLGKALDREADPDARLGHAMAMGTVAARSEEAVRRLIAIEESADLDDPAGLGAALRRIDRDEPVDETTARRFLDRMLRFDPADFRTLPWWWSLHYPPDPEEMISEADESLRRRLARLIERRPALRDLVRQRAAPGPPPIERANAIRLLTGRRNRWDPSNEEPPIHVEPDDELIVRLAAAEVEVSRPTADPYDFALPAALDGLRHPDASIRLRAAFVLGAVDASEVMPHAEKLADLAIKERDPDILSALGRAFSHLSPSDRVLQKRVRQRLQSWRQHPDGPRDWSSRRLLWDMLRMHSGIAPAREMARWLLDQIEMPRMNSMIAPAGEMARWLLDRIDDPVAVAALDPDRARAVTLLRSLRPPARKLAPVLDRLLRSDPDSKVRRAAVRSSFAVPSPIDNLPDAGTIVRALRNDPSATVRAAAAEALSPFLMDADYDPTMAGAIVRALAEALESDPDWRVRDGAATNLALAAPTAEEAQGVMSRQVMRNVGLGQSAPGRSEAVEALVKAAAGDPRHAVRDSAVRSLQNVAEAVPELVARLRSAPPQGRAGAANALYWVGEPARSAVPDLFAAFADVPERQVRRQIARAFLRLVRSDQVGRWIAPLVRVQVAPDPEVRVRIAWLIEGAGPDAAPLVPGLAENLRLDHAPLRSRTLETLASLGRVADEALPDVLALLRSDSIGLRLLAAKAAWAINGDRPPHVVAILDAIEPIAHDPAPAVRDEAAKLLRKIADELPPDRPERAQALALLPPDRLE